MRAALVNGRALIAIIALAGAVTACSSKPRAAAEAVPPAATEFVATVVLATIAPTPLPTPEPPPTPPAGPLAGRRICLDPGHDVYWVPGAAGRNRAGVLARHPVEGVLLNEHELTLSVAYRLKPLLEADGAEVCVTRKPRDQGGVLQIEPYDYTGDGRVRTSGFVEDGPERIQPRIDWANQFGAEVLVSIHFNGLEDQSVRGTEAYYTDAGPRRQDGRRLAQTLIAGLLAEMRGAGYVGIDRGPRSDAYQRYSPEETRRAFANHTAIISANGSDPANCPECYRLLTMGTNPMSMRKGTYLGVLVEVDFLSNTSVVEGFFLRPDSLDVIARGLHQGLRSYFGGE